MRLSGEGGITVREPFFNNLTLHHFVLTFYNTFDTLIKDKK